MSIFAQNLNRIFSTGEESSDVISRSISFRGPILYYGIKKTCFKADKPAWSASDETFHAGLF